jgi:hypothetical protein
MSRFATKKFPIQFHREFWPTPRNVGCLTLQTIDKASDSQNSRLFSLINGNLGVETGSSASASATNRDFPWFDEYPRFCGGAAIRGALVYWAASFPIRDECYRARELQGRRTASEAVRGLLSLASKNRFPGAWEGAARDSVRMRQRPVCSQEFREELGHDGHAIVDAHAIAGVR